MTILSDLRLCIVRVCCFSTQTRRMVHWFQRVEGGQSPDKVISLLHLKPSSDRELMP